jgi:hypothetical protein
LCWYQFKRQHLCIRGHSANSEVARRLRDDTQRPEFDLLILGGLTNVRVIANQMCFVSSRVVFSFCRVFFQKEFELGWCKVNSAVFAGMHDSDVQSCKERLMNASGGIPLLLDDFKMQFDKQVCGQFLFFFFFFDF